MKAAPEAQNPVDESKVKQALDDWLKPTLPAAEVQPLMDGPVNDLSKLVKKKKKTAEPPKESTTNGIGAPSTTSAGKRKVDEEVEDESISREKKAKIESE